MRSKILKGNIIRKDYDNGRLNELLVKFMYRKRKSIDVLFLHGGYNENIFIGMEPNKRDYKLSKDYLCGENPRYIGFQVNNRFTAYDLRGGSCKFSLEGN